MLHRRQVVHLEAGLCFHSGLCLKNRIHCWMPTRRARDNERRRQQTLQPMSGINKSVRESKIARLMCTVLQCFTRHIDHFEASKQHARRAQQTMRERDGVGVVARESLCGCFAGGPYQYFSYLNQNCVSVHSRNFLGLPPTRRL